VLYQMVTGRRPFAGTDPLACLMSLANDIPPAPSEQDPAVPAALSDLIVQLLCKDPTGRPASAWEVAATLDRLTAEPDEQRDVPAADGRAGGPGQAVPPTPRPWRRGRWAAAAAVLLAVGLAGLVMYGGTVIRIVTNKGELVIETDDPNIEVLVK